MQLDLGLAALALAFQHSKRYVAIKSYLRIRASWKHEQLSRRPSFQPLYKAKLAQLASELQLKKSASNSQQTKWVVSG